MGKLEHFIDFKQLRNQEGSALISVMIIGAVLLTLIGAFASYQFQRSKEAQAQENRSVFVQLKENVKSGAAQTQSVGKSEELDFTNLQ